MEKHLRWMWEWVSAKSRHGDSRHTDRRTDGSVPIKRPRLTELKANLCGKVQPYFSPLAIWFTLLERIILLSVVLGPPSNLKQFIDDNTEY
jgi:hypothetical protein